MAIHRPRHSAPGAAPGTLRAPAEQRVDKVTIEVMDYGPGHFEEKAPATLDEVFPYRDTPGVTWIDIVGLHDVELLARLGDHFELHPLALEDVVNTTQRPKLDDYESHLYIVLRFINLEGVLANEQISLFLGPGYVISLQEVPGDAFGPVRERIRAGKGRARKLGADYLAYALVDALVDWYFPLLERYGEKIERLEDELIDNPDESTLGRVQEVKNELLLLRRAAWPQREVINALERQEPPLVQPGTKVFLRDCYDHTIQIIDLLETYRDMAGSLVDLYLSSVSNRMNEVMKVLTIMASIFIPLTFIAGIYGMNFDTEASPWNLPELAWYWGYPAAWAVMLLVAGAMYLYFRRKKWL